jgi:drug/metabolite transporter (DMT)-like permease
MRTPWIGFFAISVAAFLWAVDGVVLRPSLYTLDVSVVVFWEHAIAIALMSPFLYMERKYLKELQIGEWSAVLWVALFGGVIGTMAITKALFYVGFIPLSVPILLQKFQPIFAIMLAMIVLKERPPKSFWKYALAAIIGSYLVTFGFQKPHFSLENKTALAAGFGLLAAFSWGSSTVFGRRVLQRANFRLSTYLRFLLTSLIMGVLLLLFGKAPLLLSPSTDQALMLVCVAISTGGLATFIYYFGLKTVPATKATFFELSFPFGAVLLDFLVNGKVLGVGQWVGALILIASVLRINSLELSKKG